MNIEHIFHVVSQIIVLVLFIALLSPLIGIPNFMIKFSVWVSDGYDFLKVLFSQSDEEKKEFFGG